MLTRCDVTYVVRNTEQLIETVSIYNLIVKAIISYMKMRNAT